MHRWLARLAVLCLATMFFQAHPSALRALDRRFPIGDAPFRFPDPGSRGLSGCGLPNALTFLETFLAQK